MADDMNGSFSFLRGVTKQAELDDGIHIRLQILGRGSARIYFVNQDGVQIDVPEGFYIRDIVDLAWLKAGVRRNLRC